ncbi:hypothetical protein IW261DRAFT_354858 [Armillaria novae-zelandiae]|uniref:C2H2-type domain-containing protein n=1 Tax=Armillaria novae-zelandiae TaxID=153914 RepID=A0AA39UGJ9_9AGAR|nr:hypothetical protein IW261DRAFT_354858 [Armillaria novae-zelandiae]
MMKLFHPRIACGLHGCKERVSGRNKLFRHILTVHTKGEMLPCCAKLSSKIRLIRHLLHHHCRRNVFQCTKCTWGANTKKVLRRHLKTYHANSTSLSSVVTKSTAEPVSYSATSSASESGMEVPTGASLQQPDVVKPPATLSHDEPMTSPNHYSFTPSALTRTTYEARMEGEEREPPSSQYTPPTLPPATESSTISTLPPVTPVYFHLNELSSSSNTPSYDPDVYLDGIYSRSPSRNIPAGTEHPLWAPSSESSFITFPQSNPYPHYPQMTEQQHFDANPAQSPDGTFGAVLPQVDGGEIMSPPYNFWSSDSALSSSGVYQLDPSPDTVAYTSSSNVLDNVTNSQSFGYQYAPQYVDSVPRGLSFTPFTNGLDNYHQAQEATLQLYYQYEENNTPRQATVNGLFVADDQEAWDGASTNAGANW